MKIAIQQQQQQQEEEEQQLPFKPKKENKGNHLIQRLRIAEECKEREEEQLLLYIAEETEHRQMILKIGLKQPRLFIFIKFHNASGCSTALWRTHAVEAALEPRAAGRLAEEQPRYEVDPSGGFKLRPRGQQVCCRNAVALVKAMWNIAAVGKEPRRMFR
ncbi:hypothetical protein EYF80_023418 [Liparis tanakae]|uniref:Uncharacterized protein n=1 Tax=Liparis tanakae TaxID=230148 RepID=A0A4Z2HKI4_9TELE|nr:hypothetical protein EYF80_023418 [Liparis tanakae]